MQNNDLHAFFETNRLYIIYKHLFSLHKSYSQQKKIKIFPMKKIKIIKKTKMRLKNILKIRGQYRVLIE